jgi:hypothetical protein
MRRLFCVGIVLVSTSANADWHSGVVRTLGFGYDGQTLVFEIAGLTRTNCTCYPTWPNSLCVSRTRADFKEIYAFLLEARAVKEPIEVNIDETTCSALALYETD